MMSKVDHNILPAYRRRSSIAGRSSIDTDDEEDQDTIFGNNENSPNRGGVVSDSLSDVVSTLSSMTLSSMTTAYSNQNNTAIQDAITHVQQQTQGIGIDQLMGQISRPGAYRIDGPRINNINVGIDYTNLDAAFSAIGYSRQPIPDSGSSHRPSDDVHEPEVNGSIQEDIPEATPVNPIEATMVPIYEGVVVPEDISYVSRDDKSLPKNVGEDRSDDEGSTNNLNSSRHNRNRTQVLEDMVMSAVENGSNSPLANNKRLNLANMKLHGREEDMDTLHTKLLELKRRKEEGDPVTTPELIMIKGSSGTGKSTLVMRGVKDPAEELGLTFAAGKFDLNNSSMPLSAFVDAMVSLTNSVIGKDQGYKIQHDINEAFSEGDRLLLARALPGSEGLFPLQQEEIYRRRASVRDYGSSESIAYHQYQTLQCQGKVAIARLHYKIGKLLQIICTYLQGVVLFIDDLQWSDTATIDLLRSLDGDIQSLLIIAAYRDDEVSDSHQIHDMEQLATVIEIGNLSLANTRSLVSEALDNMEPDVEEVKHLAFIIQKKTRGNSFFVLTFLKSLYDEKMLRYNSDSMSWAWNNVDVNRKEVTSNVANILVDKLNRLTESQKNILMIAGSLGYSFDKSIIATVITSLMESESETVDWRETLDSLDQSIDELEQEGLWERDSSNENKWRFSHDKIQQVAFELIPIEQRDSFQGEIGSIMLDKLDPKELESNIFRVVSLRNCTIASLCNDDDRRELARLNLRAGMKASENAAFDSAAEYFKAGREVLGSSGWDIDRQTMLKLCSEGANSCYICGELDKMQEMIDEVIDQDIPIQDKFCVYEVKVLSSYAAREFDAAIETVFSFRKQLGLPTFKNKSISKLVILKEVMKTNRALSNKTAEEISRLPLLTDNRIIMGQRMLELVISACYSAQPLLVPLIACLMVRVSLKHGINSSSCEAFSLYGSVLCAYGKLKEGRRMSKIVDLILARHDIDDRAIRSRSISYVGFINHWTSSLQEFISPLLEGYQLGLRCGDNESAAHNLCCRIIMLYCMGRPLADVYQEIKASIDANTKLNINEHLLVSQAYLGAVETLIGVNDDCSSCHMEEQSSSKALDSFKTIARLEVSVFLADLDDATDLLLEAGDLSPQLGGLITKAQFVFLDAFISIQAARTEATWNKKRKWKRRAMKSIKIIRDWVKSGNMNLVHRLHLLEAELAALEGKNEKAKYNYKSAITVACENGFIQDVALSHEYASSYYGSIGDEENEEYHMEQCKEYYSQWGATAKIEKLTNG